MIQPCKGRKGVHVRGYAERIGQSSRFRFVCPNGHIQTQDMNAGKRGKRHPVGEHGLAMYADWWSKERGGVSFDCKKCLLSE